MIDLDNSQLEARLREGAPILPPSLKSRTLSRCADARQKRRAARHRNLTYAFAAVFALQLLTISRLDAQNAQLIAGNAAPRPFAPISVAQLMESWQERSRQVALLLAPSRVG